jgi:hypothetical protein
MNKESQVFASGVITQLDSDTVIPGALALYNLEITPEELSERSGISWDKQHSPIVAVLQTGPNDPIFALEACGGKVGIEVLAEANLPAKYLMHLFDGLKVGSKEAFDLVTGQPIANVQ